MTKNPFLLPQWTRRKLLTAASAACASTAFPRILNAVAQAGQKKPANTEQKPFSTFVDVSQSAGLKAKMVYGTSVNNTFIFEVMGGGCAFFDYDNDGWMDVFIVGGTLLTGNPSDASNRLYKNNRDGTFTDVTKQAGLWDCG